MTVKIGIDFDEPIYKWYDFAHAASVKAGIATLEHEPTSWAPHKHYGVSLEEWIAVLDNEIDNGDMYHQPFDPEAVDAIKRLYKRGFEIHIVTARGSLGEKGEQIKDITRSEIIKQGLPHDSLHFAKDKVPISLELGLDYFIDDAPHNFDPLLAAGVNVFLLDERWNQDHPATWYDKGWAPLPGRPESRRVHSITEFGNMIMDRHFTPATLTEDQKQHIKRNTSWGTW